MLLITVVIAIAVIATIAATGGFEPGATPTPTPTPTSTALPIAEDVFTNSFYPTDVRGGYVYKLYFELFNGSTETITISKIKFYDESGVVFTVWEQDLIEIRGSTAVAPSEKCKGAIVFDQPVLEIQVKQWEAEWHCVRADGQDFVVPGAFEEGF